MNTISFKKQAESLWSMLNIYKYTSETKSEQQQKSIKAMESELEIAFVAGRNHRIEEENEEKKNGQG